MAFHLLPPPPLRFWTFLVLFPGLRKAQKCDYVESSDNSLIDGNGCLIAQVRITQATFGLCLYVWICVCVFKAEPHHTTTLIQCEWS